MICVDRKNVHLFFIKRDCVDILKLNGEKKKSEEVCLLEYNAM
jgi:hypothetical protein